MGETKKQTRIRKAAGRPPLAPEKRRTKRLGINFTDEEFATVRKAASTAKADVQDWTRDALLDRAAGVLRRAAEKTEEPKPEPTV